MVPQKNEARAQARAPPTPKTPSSQIQPHPHTPLAKPPLRLPEDFFLHTATAARYLPVMRDKKLDAPRQSRILLVCRTNPQDTANDHSTPQPVQRSYRD